MVNMFLTAIRTGFIEGYLRIQGLVPGRFDDAAPVIKDSVVRAFKPLVLVRTDKNQFHMLTSFCIPECRNK
jgi:hypothetical protein